MSSLIEIVERMRSKTRDKEFYYWLYYGDEERGAKIMEDVAKILREVPEQIDGAAAVEITKKILA